MKFCDGALLLVFLTICGAEQQYKAGIALRNLGEVVITDDYASLAVVCSTQELELLVDRCNYALRFLKDKLQETPSTLRQQVSSLELQVSAMNNKLSQLRRMFWENGLGNTELKLLYGGSLEEAQLMNEKVEEELSKSDANKRLPILKQPDLRDLWDTTQQLVHELEASTWPTKDILLREIELFKKSVRNVPSFSRPDREESNNTSLVLNATVSALKYLKQSHSKDMINTAEFLENLHHAFEDDISLSARLSFFDYVVRDLNEKMLLFQESLSFVLVSGRLNPQLVPPGNLTMAIRDAYRDLPKSVKPLFDLNYNYDGEVHPYYSLSLITVVLFKNSIRIFVDVPMRAENRLFHLYEAHSLPVYSNAAGYFLQIVPPSDILLVNKMKDKAAWMKASSLLKECKYFGERFVCPTVTALETVDNSCILNMLLMKIKGVSRLCKAEAILEDIASTWIRDKNGWIYSVPRSTRLERVTEDTRTAEVFSVSGTGFLKDQKNTYTKTADGFILYPALNNLAREILVPNVDLTSLVDLKILKTSIFGNETNTPTLRDPSWRKESLVEEDSPPHCDSTSIWAFIIINFLLLVSLALWVFTIRRPFSQNKAPTKTPSEESVKMNGVDVVDN